MKQSNVKVRGDKMDMWYSYEKVLFTSRWLLLWCCVGYNLYYEVIFLLAEINAQCNVIHCLHSQRIILVVYFFIYLFYLDTF